MQLIQLYLIRILMLAVMISTTIGFRLLEGNTRWNISEEDPYLWLKMCDRTTVFPANTVEEGDLLFGEKQVTILQAVQAILADANNIFGSYVRVEEYPDDVNVIPAGSHFNLAKAEKRTITICNGSYLLASGVASSSTDGGYVTGCDIKYSKDNLGDVRDFTDVLTHELGHCLGLGHPQEIVDGIMSYFARGDIYRYALDDKMGIRYLYPANIENVDFKEHNTYGLSCAYRE